MNIRNSIIILIVLVFSIALLAGCKQNPVTPPPVSEKSCEIDSDCACGKHIETGECFYGNKAFVNVEEQCPDFCTGIGGNLDIKCLNNTCTQVNVRNECQTDSDCVSEQCCHGTSCINKANKGVCTLLCTNVCLPGTLDCGGSCTCENGKCTANLNNLTSEVTPPVAECTSDDDCIPGECCHPTTCKAGKEQPECAAVSCDASCKAGTLDCGGSCTCEDGKCTANLNNITPPAPGKCATDSDCVASECCHPTTCVTADKQPDCAAVSCTAVCAPGTLDCGGSCTCEDGECIANLNDYTQEEPIPTGACTTDDDCVPAECCHAAECTTKDNQPDCTAVLCSQECRGQTMDCGGFCACIGGRCIAELNDL